MGVEWGFCGVGGENGVYWHDFRSDFYTSI